MSFWIVNTVGLILILFVIEWFWAAKKKSPTAIAKNIIDIKVANGVYFPDNIQIKKGQTITLRFIREDETPCAGIVIFADFNKSAELPIGQAVDLVLTPDKVGEFTFTCQMGMYRGKLVVVRANVH